MAYEERINPITLKAPTTAFSTKQFYFVVPNTTAAGYFKLPSTNSTGNKRPMAGVLQDAPTVAGEACSVATYGSISKARSGSTQLAAGMAYRITSAGIARRASSGVSAREILYGPWLSAAASTATIGTCMVNVVGITT